jgi:hypothetical protein
MGVVGTFPQITSFFSVQSVSDLVRDESASAIKASVAQVNRKILRPKFLCFILLFTPFHIIILFCL